MCKAVFGRAFGVASASIGDPQSLNLFAYVTNNPVDFVDPSGLYVDASSCVLVCAQSFDKDGNPTGPKDCEYKCEEAKIVESEETGPITGGEPFPPDVGGGSSPKQDDPDKVCNRKIAALFGGNGANVATRLDWERRLGKVLGRTLDRSDHLYKNGVFHIYSDETGDPDIDTALYVPKGAKYVGGGEYLSGNNKEPQNLFTFSLGVEYKGVTVTFVHVAGTYGGKYDGENLGKEYKKGGKLIGGENESGTSVQIGIIGGLGGEGAKGTNYRHSHVIVKLNGKRIDPRKVFCSPKKKEKR